MNKKQMRFLWAGIIIICLMGLFPPWTQEVTFLGSKFSDYAKYSCIFYPPSFKLHLSSSTLKISERDKEILLLSDSISNYSVHINITILFIQWICIALLTFGFILTFRKKIGDSKQL
jgi:hypothetical protein